MTLPSRTNPQLPYKVGSTFEFQGCQLQQDGTPVDLTNYHLSSQIRQLNRTLVAELPVVVDSADPTKFNVLSPGNEGEWPAQKLFWDIRYESPTGAVFYSQTIEVNANRRETWHTN